MSDDPVGRITTEPASLLERRTAEESGVQDGGRPMTDKKAEHVVTEPERRTSSKWTEGVVIGVSSGLILSVVISAIGAVSGAIERRDQIRYLANLLTDYRDIILYDRDETVSSAVKVITPRYDSEAQAQVVVRWSLYDNNMRSRLESALQGRASRLSYDEIREVRNAALNHGDVVRRTAPDSGVQNFISEAGYRQLFRRLECIDWLGMTKKGGPCPG